MAGKAGGGRRELGSAECNAFGRGIPIGYLEGGNTVKASATSAINVGLELRASKCGGTVSYRSIYLSIYLSIFLFLMFVFSPSFSQSYLCPSRSGLVMHSFRAGPPVRIEGSSTIKSVL